MCEGHGLYSVLPNTAALPSRYNPVTVCSGRFFGDRYPALSQLRIYLHGKLPYECAGPGEHQAGILWSLPLEPLVHSGCIAPSTSRTLVIDLSHNQHEW